MVNVQTWRLEDVPYTLPPGYGEESHATSIDMIDDFLLREPQDWMTTTSACVRPHDDLREPKKVEPSLLEPYPLTSFNLLKDEPSSTTQELSSFVISHEMKNDEPAREFPKYQEEQWQKVYRALLC